MNILIKTRFFSRCLFFLLLAIPIALFSQNTAASIDAEIKQLQQQLEKNQVTTVLLRAEKLKQQSPQNIEVRKLLFQIYLKSNLLSKADEEISFIEKVVRSSEVKHLRSLLFYQLGELEPSKRTALDIVANDIRFSDSYLLLSKIASDENFYVKAADYLEQYKNIEGRNKDYLRESIELNMLRIGDSKRRPANTLKNQVTAIAVLVQELGRKFEKDETFFSLNAKLLLLQQQPLNALKEIDKALYFNSYDKPLKLLKARILFVLRDYENLIAHLNALLADNDKLLADNDERKQLLTLLGFTHFIKEKINGEDWRVKSPAYLTDTTIPPLLSALALEGENEILRFFIESLVAENLNLKHPLRTEFSQHHHLKAVEAFKQGKIEQSRESFLHALNLDPQNPTIRIDYVEYLLKKKYPHAASQEMQIINQLTDNQYFSDYNNSVRYDLLKRERSKTLAAREKIAEARISMEQKNKVLLVFKRHQWQDHFDAPYSDIVLRDMLKRKLSTSRLISLQQIEDSSLEYAIARQNPNYYLTYSLNNATNGKAVFDLSLVPAANRKTVEQAKIVVSGNDRYDQLAARAKQTVLQQMPLTAKVIKIVGFRLLVSIGEIHGLQKNQNYEATLEVKEGTNSKQTIGPFPITTVEEMISQVEVRDFFILPKIKIGDSVTLQVK